MTTPTVAGTRPGGAIASAWSVLHYLGVEGYRDKTRRILKARKQIARGVEDLGLRVFGDPNLCLISFGPVEGDDLSIFGVWKGMHDRGWFSGVVQNPNGIHLMLSPSHDEVADAYLKDLEASIAMARGGEEDSNRAPTRYA
jgi:glutamate/tyrosine decarboxylase-like PLP-dependent enzyme